MGNGVNESRNILILPGDTLLGYVFLMREENQLLHLVFSRLAKNTCLSPVALLIVLLFRATSMFDLKIHNFLLSLECYFSPLEVSKLLDTTDKSKNCDHRSFHLFSGCPICQVSVAESLC